jgi:photosystem II stability/assembly factor-like uncharacterized protein
MHRFLSFIQCVWILTFGLAVSSGVANAQYWVPDTAGLSAPVSSLAVAPDGTFFAGALTKFGSYAGVYRSTDNGGTWSLIPKPAISEAQLGPVYGVDATGEVFVGGSTRQLRSADDGNSWQQMVVDAGSPFDPVIGSFTIGLAGSMFASSQGSELWASDNYGDSWYEQGVFQDFTNFPSFAAASQNGLIFAGTQTSLARATGRTGEFWDSIPGAPAFGAGVAFGFLNTGLIVAGGTGGLFFSKDSGNYWAPITPAWGTNSTYYILAVSQDGEIFIGTNSTNGKTGGISVSPDTGKTWKDISSGLTTDTINALAFNNSGTLFAATDNGVFKYSPSGLGGVKEGSAGSQSSIVLDQNSPNPVNGTTSIRFSLSEPGAISLSVFDPTGRMVAIVTNGYYAPGTYHVSFNASSLSNGAYYYRLEDGDQHAERMFVIDR